MDASADTATYAFYERVASRVASEQTVSTYLDLSALAFDSCVHGFSGGRLSSAEAKCVNNVSHKYLAHYARVTQRFAEAQTTYTKERLAEAEAARREVSEGGGERLEAVLEVAVGCRALYAWGVGEGCRRLSRGAIKCAVRSA